MDVYMKELSDKKYKNLKVLLNLYASLSSVAKSCLDNFDKIAYVIESFSDDLSRQVFLRELLYRVNCQITDTHFAGIMQGFDLASYEYQNIKAQYDTKFKDIKIPYFDNLPKEKEHIKINGLGDIFLKEKYKYYEDSNSNHYIGAQENDICIDIGCYVGDSSLFFLRQSKVKKLYCIDLKPIFLQACEKTLKINGYKKDKNFALIHAHLYDKEIKDAYYVERGWVSEIVREAQKYAAKYGWQNLKKIDKTETLDSVVAQYKIRPNCIKVSEQHEEVEVIKGAYDTIKEFSPILIVMMYEIEHFYDVITFLQFINKNYKFYTKRLGKYSEIVLFAKG